MILRDYQQEAKRAVFQKLCDCKATLVEMATGLGKTVVFAHIANEWPGRVLVIAHRDELIRQAAEKIQRITGEQVAVEMGRERAEDNLYGSKVTVGSIQTLARSNRRKRFHSDHFSLIVVDEGHHAAAVTYQETLNYFPSARNLFVTATPLRADNVIMENVYQSVAFRYGIEKAIDNGWLVPIQQKVVKIDGLDFSKVRTLAEDFNQGDLEKILTEEKPLHGMCASAVDIIGNKQSLWFCVSVSHAKAMANVLSRYAGANQVCFLSGDTDKEERRAAVDAYKSGRIQHLVNCALFLEGFDAPHTSAIVMARPTKSLPLYVQVLGRGTRPLPGTVDGLDGADERRTAISISDKPNMLVIDFAGNAGRHKIIQAADIFGGKYDLPIREYAKQTNSQEGQTVDLEEQLERAKEELSLEREEEERLGKIKAKIKADSANYRTYDVDPFITRQYAGARDKAKRKFEPCTDKTAWKILYLSREAGGDWTFDKAKRLTQRQASGVIGSLQPQKVNHEY